MKNTTIIHELPISQKLYGILNDYINETKFDEKSYNDVDEFIIEAIVEKFNNENEIFASEVDENGFVVSFK